MWRQWWPSVTISSWSMVFIKGSWSHISDLLNGLQNHHRIGKISFNCLMNEKSRDRGWVLGTWPCQEELSQAGQKEQKGGDLVCDRKNQRESPTSPRCSVHWGTFVSCLLPPEIVLSCRIQAWPRSSPSSKRPHRTLGKEHGAAALIPQMSEWRQNREKGLLQPRALGTNPQSDHTWRRMFESLKWEDKPLYRSLTRAELLKDARGGISKESLGSVAEQGCVCTWNLGSRPCRTLQVYNGNLLILSFQCHHLWHLEATFHAILLGMPIMGLVFSLNDLRNGYGQLLH